MVPRSVMMTILVLWLTGSAEATTDYYAVDGSGNNVLHPTWGAAQTQYLRTQMTAATDYTNNNLDHASGLPSARLISTSLNLPSYSSRARDGHANTDMLTFLGQLLKHEIVLTKAATAEEEPISVPFCDFHFDQETCGLDEVALAAETPQTLSFYRSAYELDDDDERQQINEATAFIDGGAIYGHDATTESQLRTYVGGKMKSYNNELPLNTMGLPLADPVAYEEAINLRQCAPRLNLRLEVLASRATGDGRANTHPVMLALHSLFLREHNRLADALLAEWPGLSDEELYRRARKWVTAMLQKICYYEYLPAMGIEVPLYTAYDSNVNPGLDNFFSAAAFRFGHAQIFDVIFRIDDEGREIPAGHLLLHEAYYRPTLALSDGIEPILRGATVAGQAKIAPRVSNALQNYLFGSPSHGGLDLLALNIQRSRDHGLPLYNEAREQLQLTQKTTFAEITDDYRLSQQLEDVYGTVDNVDAYIGGLAETPSDQKTLGELFSASITDQFRRLRDGDRFYYENSDNGLFTEAEIALINSTSGPSPASTRR